MFAGHFPAEIMKTQWVLKSRSTFVKLHHEENLVPIYWRTPCIKTTRAKDPNVPIEWTLCVVHTPQSFQLWTLTPRHICDLISSNKAESRLIAYRARTLGEFMGVQRWPSLAMKVSCLEKSDWKWLPLTQELDTLLRDSSVCPPKGLWQSSPCPQHR